MSETKKKKESLAERILIKLLDVAGSYLEAPSPYELEKLHLFLFKTYPNNRARVRSELKRMEKRGWVRLEYQGPKIKVLISKSGRDFLFKKKVNKQLSVPKKWDRRWRLVIFDIPEEKKLNRNGLRGSLKRMGFIQVQRSVWAHPGDCRSEVLALSELYQVEPFVSLFEGRYLGNDRELRQAFGL